MDNKISRFVRIFLVILFLSLLAFIIYSVFGTNYNIPFSDALYKIGRSMGLTGFLFISILIISGDLARLFDKYIGIDKIIKFQRKFSIFTYFIVFSHPLIFIISNLYYFKNLYFGIYNLPLIFGAISFYLLIGIMIASLNYKRISYKSWQYIHFITYALFFSVFIHASFIGSSSEKISIKLMYISLSVLVIVGLIYRLNYKIRQMENKFFVKSLKWETKNTFTLIVETKKKISFNPGQFFFIRIEGKDLYARHPFSASNEPGSNEIHFTIKLAGRFTQQASKLKPGEEVKVEGPFGNFILGDEKDLVFIAGGVGITPFMSMIKNNTERKKKITLLYGSKTEKDIIFRDELDKMSKDWLNTVYFLSAEKKEGYEFGRMNKDLIGKYIKDFQGKKFYICGPQEMNFLVRDYLIEFGVKSEDILFEDFFW